MKSQKFQTSCNCVGGKQKFGTKNIVGEITYNKKNWKRN